MKDRRSMDALRLYIHVKEGGGRFEFLGTFARSANGFEGAFEALTIQATGSLPVIFDWDVTRRIHEGRDTHCECERTQI